MKITKRVIAIVLAALMLAAMIPLTMASAAETYTLNVTSSKEGFAFEVIKVADIDTTTGTYSSEYDGVLTALKNGDAVAALAACDAINWNETNYAAAATYTTADKGVKAVTGLAAGVYYVRWTEKPDTVSKVVNRVIPLPYYKDGEWKTYEETIDLASKIDVEPTVSKAIVEDETLTDRTVVAIGDTVDFRLTATVAGSATDKLDKYSIVDTMEKGLTYTDGSATVKLVKAGANDRVLGASEFTVVPANDNTSSFRVDLATSVLESDDFYTYTDVVVDFKAVLNEDAKVGAAGNENTDSLEYTHKADPEIHKVPGNTVYVFTIQIDVVKIDANTKEPIKNNKAEFTLFGSDKTTVLKTGETDDNGELSFVGLDEGTYYVQETKAPVGYNLNTYQYEIKLKADLVDEGGKVVLKLNTADGNTTNKIEVEDTESTIPTTGGAGTMMFMVIGGSLILLAGVLLVIVMKKRSK